MATAQAERKSEARDDEDNPGVAKSKPRAEKREEGVEGEEGRECCRTMQRCGWGSSKLGAYECEQTPVRCRAANTCYLLAWHRGGGPCG